MALDNRIKGVGILEAYAMPARLLWQTEETIWMLDRVERRARLEAEADRAHAAAVARMERGGRP